MIASLIDNATKYCGEHGKIGLRLTADSKRARLSVMNTGEAVSEEDAKHVFDRFYRSDGARRNPDGNSFGLGLAIVKATVTAHGGTINCCGIEGKGRCSTSLSPPLLSKTSARKTEQKGATPVNDSEDELRSCTGEALFLTSDDEPPTTLPPTRSDPAFCRQRRPAPPPLRCPRRCGKPPVFSHRFNVNEKRLMLMKGFISTV